MKNELVRSLVEHNVYKNEELAKRTDNVTNYEGPIPVVKDFKKIIRSKKKNILNVLFRQGILFIKFKQSEKFVEMVKELGVVSKSIIYFKINLIKF